MSCPKTPTTSRVLRGLEWIRPLHLPDTDDEEVVIISPPPPTMVDLTADSDEEDDIPWEAEDNSQEEEEEESNWPIHQGFLAVTLRDVAQEDNCDRLEQWLDQYTPSTQPRSEAEHFYVDLMSHAIRERLWQLHI